MSVDLSQEVVTAKVIYTGDGTFNAVAGQSIKLETTPGGEEISILKNGEDFSTVPEGKAWSVTSFFRIEETDA